jgi:hypothetical protein
MKVAIEQIFDGSIQQVPITGAYDPDKISRGPHVGQYNLGSGEIDKFIGPNPIDIANNGNTQLAIPSSMYSIVKINEDLYWIFGNDAAAASTTRRVQLWTFVPSTNTYTFVGAIILNFPGGGSATAISTRAALTNYTSGSVSVISNQVTGSSTTWNTGLSVGSRIGFGSTNPNQISAWYPISNIGSDTSLTISGSLSASLGTPYVIQDLMILQANSNSNNLFVAKGLRYEDFSIPATNIPTASLTDKVKAVYGLSTVGSSMCGLDISNFESWTLQRVFVVAQAGPQFQPLRLGFANFRAPLTSLSAGVQTGSFTTYNQLSTDGFLAPLATVNNGVIGTLSAGVLANTASMYFYTNPSFGITGAVYGTPLEYILNGSSSLFLKTGLAFDAINNKPGGANTNLFMQPTASSVTVDDVTGKILMIMGSSGSLYAVDLTSPAGTITASFTPNAVLTASINRRSTVIESMLPNTLKNKNAIPHAHVIPGNTPTLSAKDGWMLFNYTSATTATVNSFTAYPMGADLEYANVVNNRVICPRINLGVTPTKYYRVLVNCAKNIGDSKFGVTPDMYKLQYRTSGISNNSGSWIDVRQDGNLYQVTPSNEIQFAFQFRTMGSMMLPARVLSLVLLYEDQESIASFYRWNIADFNPANGTFAWIQINLSPITHKYIIEIYRFQDDLLLLSQDTNGTTNGIFEYWNGEAWVTGLGNNIIGTRRRFVPTRLIPKDTNVYAKLLLI